ncbi:MAG: hypothetical protein M1825_004847 [Sarcosagium campestre]|nr:MAG: hypothetical protein M1825_004847 [Sarcosagium campestre]
MDVTWRRLIDDIDWIGAILASTALGLLSYVFAMITSSHDRLRDPEVLAPLCVAVALIPTFIFWVGRQEKAGRPAVIPNSLWRNRVFSYICLMVFINWGAFNAVTFFITLFFQEVQRVSALQTSLRFLPMVVSGAITNVATGMMVNRVSANVLVVFSSTLTAISALLIAITDPSWLYWYSAFPAVLLSPICSDVLFTVSNLVITSVFPSKTQALAGSVFNVVSQIGNSVGLALTAVLAASVTRASPHEDKLSATALLGGYRASFWACFGAMVTMVGVGTWGLRRIGKFQTALTPRSVPGRKDSSAEKETTRPQWAMEKTGTITCTW